MCDVPVLAAGCGNCHEHPSEATQVIPKQWHVRKACKTLKEKDFCWSTL